jgi:hypothetical protein
MTQARHPLGQHLATCSSPDNCAEYAAVTAMTPIEYHRWLTVQDAQLRTACAAAADAAPVATAFDARKLSAATATDAYTRRRLDAMNATRAALDAEQPPQFVAAAELEPYVAPSPYAAGLAALKKETR